MSILEATHRGTECSAAGAVIVGITAVEVEAARNGIANRTAPIEAVGPNKAERTIAVVAVACHRQF